jgi:hypothetical protein
MAGVAGRAIFSASNLESSDSEEGDVAEVAALLPHRGHLTVKQWAEASKADVAPDSMIIEWLTVSIAIHDPAGLWPTVEVPLRQLLPIGGSWGWLCPSCACLLTAVAAGLSLESTMRHVGRRATLGGATKFTPLDSIMPLFVAQSVPEPSAPKAPPPLWKRSGSVIASTSPVGAEVTSWRIGQWHADPVVHLYILSSPTVREYRKDERQRLKDWLDRQSPRVPAAVVFVTPPTDPTRAPETPSLVPFYRSGPDVEARRAWDAASADATMAKHGAVPCLSVQPHSPDVRSSMDRTASSRFRPGAVRKPTSLKTASAGWSSFQNLATTLGMMIQAGLSSVVRQAQRDVETSARLLNGKRMSLVQHCALVDSLCLLYARAGLAAEALQEYNNMRQSVRLASQDAEEELLDEYIAHEPELGLADGKGSSRRVYRRREREILRVNALSEAVLVEAKRSQMEARRPQQVDVWEDETDSRLDRFGNRTVVSVALADSDSEFVSTLMRAASSPLQPLSSNPSSVEAPPMPESASPPRKLAHSMTGDDLVLIPSEPESAAPSPRKPGSQATERSRWSVMAGMTSPEREASGARPDLLRHRLRTGAFEAKVSANLPLMNLPSRQLARVAQAVAMSAAPSSVLSEWVHKHHPSALGHTTDKPKPSHQHQQQHFQVAAPPSMPPRLTHTTDYAGLVHLVRSVFEHCTDTMSGGPFESVGVPASTTPSSPADSGADGSPAVTPTVVSTASTLLPDGTELTRADLIEYINCRRATLSLKLGLNLEATLQLARKAAFSTAHAAMYALEQGCSSRSVHIAMTVPADAPLPRWSRDTEFLKSPTPGRPMSFTPPPGKFDPGAMESLGAATYIQSRQFPTPPAAGADGRFRPRFWGRWAKPSKVSRLRAPDGTSLPSMPGPAGMQLAADIVGFCVCLDSLEATSWEPNPEAARKLLQGTDGVSMDEIADQYERSIVAAGLLLLASRRLKRILDAARAELAAAATWTREREVGNEAEFEDAAWMPHHAAFALGSWLRASSSAGAMSLGRAIISPWRRGLSLEAKLTSQAAIAINNARQLSPTVSGLAPASSKSEEDLFSPRRETSRQLVQESSSDLILIPPTVTRSSSVNSVPGGPESRGSEDLHVLMQCVPQAWTRGLLDIPTEPRRPSAIAMDEQASLSSLCIGHRRAAGLGWTAALSSAALAWDIEEPSSVAIVPKLSHQSVVWKEAGFAVPCQAAGLVSSLLESHACSRAVLDATNAVLGEGGGSSEAIEAMNRCAIDMTQALVTATRQLAEWSGHNALWGGTAWRHPLASLARAVVTHQVGPRLPSKALLRPESLAMVVCLHMQSSRLAEDARGVCSLSPARIPHNQLLEALQLAVDTSTLIAEWLRRDVGVASLALLRAFLVCRPDAVDAVHDILTEQAHLAHSSSVALERWGREAGPAVDVRSSYVGTLPPDGLPLASRLWAGSVVASLKPLVTLAAAFPLASSSFDASWTCTSQAGTANSLLLEAWVATPLELPVSQVLVELMLRKNHAGNASVDWKAAKAAADALYPSMHGEASPWIALGRAEGEEDALETMPSAGGIDELALVLECLLATPDGATPISPATVKRRIAARRIPLSTDWAGDWVRLGLWGRSRFQRWVASLPAPPASRSSDLSKPTAQFGDVPPADAPALARAVSAKQASPRVAVMTGDVPRRKSSPDKRKRSSARKMLSVRGGAMWTRSESELNLPSDAEAALAPSLEVWRTSRKDSASPSPLHLHEESSAVRWGSGGRDRTDSSALSVTSETASDGEGRGLDWSEPTTPATPRTRGRSGSKAWDVTSFTGGAIDTLEVSGLPDEPLDSPPRASVVIPPPLAFTPPLPPPSFGAPATGGAPPQRKGGALHAVCMWPPDPLRVSADSPLPATASFEPGLNTLSLPVGRLSPGVWAVKSVSILMQDGLLLQDRAVRAASTLNERDASKYTQELRRLRRAWSLSCEVAKHPSTGLDETIAKRLVTLSRPPCPAPQLDICWPSCPLRVAARLGGIARAPLVARSPPASTSPFLEVFLQIAPVSAPHATSPIPTCLVRLAIELGDSLAVASRHVASKLSDFHWLDPSLCLTERSTVHQLGVRPPVYPGEAHRAVAAVELSQTLLDSTTPHAVIRIPLEVPINEEAVHAVSIVAVADGLLSPRWDSPVADEGSADSPVPGWRVFPGSLTTFHLGLPLA